MTIEFMDADWRGVDRTNLPPGDCSLYQNAPYELNGKLVIPSWWLAEDGGASPEQINEWLQQIACGKAVLED